MERSTAAVLTSAARALLYVAFIAVTIHYGRKPGLRGKITPVLFALINGFAFAVGYETCIRWEYCTVTTDFFRVWSGVVSIHFALAWVVTLRDLARYVARLIESSNPARPPLTLPMFGHYAPPQAPPPNEDGPPNVGY